jgi:Biotin carboxylase C-terminal domain
MSTIGPLLNEARLCSEDAANDFMPKSGHMKVWQIPEGLRVEHALCSGAEIPRYHDSMIAKLVSSVSNPFAPPWKLARELAGGPTVAPSLIRKLYWESPENSFEDQLNREYQSQRIAGGSEDFREGVAAFREKRPAKFAGK